MTPTRRQVLAGAGVVVGAGAVSGAAASQVTAEDIETWEPPAGAWPGRRHDSGDTNVNPDASPPDDPAVEWRVQLDVSSTEPEAFVVGPDRVYVHADRLAARNRRDGTVEWTRREPTGELVVRDGTLYHRSETDGETTLSAFDAGTGEPRWRTDLPERSVDMTLTADHLVVNGRAYDVADGRLAWTLENASRLCTSAASDGFLYSQPSDDRLAKYDDRSALDETLDRGPRPVWKQDYDDTGGYTVVQDEHVVRGTHGLIDSEPVLNCFDAETGSHSWSALDPAEFDAETDGYYGNPDDYGLSTWVMAVATERCFVVARTHSFEDPEAAREAGSALFALSLSDGNVEWSRSVGSAEVGVRDIAVSDGTVVVAAQQAESRDRSANDAITGDVVALDGETGEPEWQLSTDGEPYRVATVDETIFALTADDTDVSLLSLR